MANLRFPRVVAAVLSILVAAGQPPPATAGDDPTLQPGWLKDAIAREVSNTGQAPTTQSSAAGLGKRSWPARHPVLMGTMIGAGAAAGIDAATCRTCGFAWIGAGAGAWTGFLSSSIRKRGRKYDRAVSGGGRSVADVIVQLGVGERIVLTTTSGQELRATIREIGATSFLVVPRGEQTPAEIAFTDVQSVGPQPLGTGGKVAIVGGAVTAILITASALTLVYCEC